MSPASYKLHNTNTPACWDFTKHRAIGDKYASRSKNKLLSTASHDFITKMRYNRWFNSMWWPRFRMSVLQSSNLYQSVFFQFKEEHNWATEVLCITYVWTTFCSASTTINRITLLWCCMSSLLLLVPLLWDFPGPWFPAENGQRLTDLQRIKLSVFQRPATC